MVKELLIFTAGVAVGSGVVYTYFKHHLEAKYDAEISESKAFYEDRLKALAGMKEKPVNEAKKGLKQADFDAPIFDEVEKQEEEYNRDKIIEKLNYNTMFKGQKDDDEEEEEQEEQIMNSSSVVSSDARLDPYIISDDTYYSDTEYEKETISYYSESKVFVTPKGDIVPYGEMIELIGKESYLEEFGGYETDTLFVRNPEEGVDYEIILEEREYDGE